MHFLRGDQVQLGEELSKGSYGSVRLVKSISSPHFLDQKKYVAKLLLSENNVQYTRRSLAVEATNVAITHPSFVTCLGMTLTDPCMLIMEFWPHGHLGKYW